MKTLLLILFPLILFSHERQKKILFGAGGVYLTMGAGLSVWAIVDRNEVMLGASGIQYTIGGLLFYFGIMRENIKVKRRSTILY